MIQEARGKSRRELEAELIGELPVEVPRAETRIKAVAKNLNRLELFVDDVFLRDLEQLRALRIHAESSGDAAKLIHAAIRKELEREQKRRFGSGSVTDSSPADAQISSSPENPKRVKSSNSAPDLLKRAPIPAAVRAQGHHKAHGKCQFRDVETNRTCDSLFALEIDHVISVQAGGTNIADNLRVLCSAHHRYRHQIESREANLRRDLCGRNGDWIGEPKASSF